MNNKQTYLDSGQKITTKPFSGVSYIDALLNMGGGGWGVWCVFVSRVLWFVLWVGVSRSAPAVHQSAKLRGAPRSLEKGEVG